jgi:hypothetical protein
VVFAVGHYSDSRNQAEAESTSLVALYDALGVDPPRDQADRSAQHRLLHALDRLRRLAVDGGRELDQAITLLCEGTNPSTLRPCRDIPPK